MKTQVTTLTLALLFVSSFVFAQEAEQAVVETISVTIDADDSETPRKVVVEITQEAVEADAAQEAAQEECQKDSDQK